MLSVVSVPLWMIKQTLIESGISVLHEFKDPIVSKLTLKDNRIKPRVNGFLITKLNEGNVKTAINIGSSQYKDYCYAVTSGSNLIEISKYPWVDPTRLVSNDMNEMTSVFGVEACFVHHKNELSIVMKKAKASDTNARHILLCENWIFHRGRPHGINFYGGRSRGTTDIITSASSGFASKTIITSAENISKSSTKNTTTAVVVGSDVKVGKQASFVVYPTREKLDMYINELQKNKSKSVVLSHKEFEKQLKASSDWSIIHPGKSTPPSVDNSIIIDGINYSIILKRKKNVMDAPLIKEMLLRSRGLPNQYGSRIIKQEHVSEARSDMFGEVVRNVTHEAPKSEIIIQDAYVYNPNKFSNVNLDNTFFGF